MRLIDADALKRAIATIMPSRVEVNLVVDDQPTVMVCSYGKIEGGVKMYISGYGYLEQLEYYQYLDSIMDWLFEDDFELLPGLWVMIVSNRISGEFRFVEVKGNE